MESIIATWETDGNGRTRSGYIYESRVCDRAGGAGGRDDDCIVQT